MNCVPILEAKGYSLKGYSPDTYARLIENNVSSLDECESWFMYLEAVYG